MYFNKTKTAFVSSYLLNAPFWAIFKIFPFILFKDLNASPFQISLVIALQPVMALFSVYWSHYVRNRPDRLKNNVIWGTVIGHLPFFFIPWINQAWYCIFAVAICMLFQRGVIPAWMELLKRNIPRNEQKTFFADVSTICYIANALFPLLFGWLLDGSYQAWRWIFPLTALISLSAVLIQARLPILKEDKPPPPAEPFLWHHNLLRPWQDAWQLLRQRPDFLAYQWGFMLCGFGLMVVQPALPEFFMNVLDLSYTELGIALTICKGIGFAMTSRLWAKWMNHIDIFRFLGMVNCVAALFPLGVMMARWDVMWVYAAYLLYGVMQAGSELGWKLSGPIFSEREDSSLYSSVNVLTVGLRGCIAPFVGSLLLTQSGVHSVLLLSFVLSSSAAFYMYLYKKRLETTFLPSSKF